MRRGVRSADYDERLKRLFEARSQGDTAFLIESLRRDPETAPLAASWLANQGVAEAIPALVRMLDVSDSFARSAAVRALDALGPPELAKARLIEIAKHDDDRFVRSSASTALGGFRDHALTPLLISLLRDPDWPVRSGAAIGLGRLGDKTALGPLRAGLRGLWRSPFRWYVQRLAYKRAIQALEQSS